MKKITLSAVAILSMAGTFSSTLCADDSFTLFSNTKWNGEVRARYENVDDESNKLNEANANTVRVTLGLEAGLLGLNGLSMKVDGTTVQTIGGLHYNGLNSEGNNKNDTVADPEQTRFTQGYLQYKYGKTTGKVGRQIVNLDNERFIGSVDWRQMPQSLDAVTLTDTSINNLSLYGSYVYSYAQVFDRPTQDSKSVLLNASYKVNDMVKVTAYDYMLSLENGGKTTNFAADTYGLAFTGDIAAAGAKIAYRAEYAQQGDSTFDTPNTNIEGKHDGDYYNLDALANISGILVGAGYEFLSGTDASAANTNDTFQTPLATLHKFNGWADKFLTTPKGGLCDASATLGYTNPTLGKVMAVYHDFETDKSMGGKSDLGSEWDMLYTNAIPGIKGLNGLVKAAFYDGGDIAKYDKNVEKIWLQLDYKF
jgi:hypothetical protein